MGTEGKGVLLKQCHKTMKLHGVGEGFGRGGLALEVGGGWVVRSAARRIALGIVVCKLNNSQLHFRCIDIIISPQLLCPGLRFLSRSSQSCFRVLIVQLPLSHLPFVWVLHPAFWVLSVSCRPPPSPGHLSVVQCPVGNLWSYATAITLNWSDISRFSPLRWPLQFLQRS